MKFFTFVLTAWLLALPASSGAQNAHAIRQSAQGLAFHYGLVPAELVLAHPREHPERQMHGGGKRGQNHIVLALFDGEQRVAEADVTVHVTLAGGPSVTRRLEPMTIAGQPGFGGFVSMGAPGIYRIRFEVRRPGQPQPERAEFEHRISPELRK